MPPDELEASDGPSAPFPFLEGTGDSLANSILEMLELLASAEDERDAGLQRSLARMRENANEVADLLHDQYRALPAEDYRARWIVAFALARLDDDAALPALSRILAEPVPQERSADPHTYSTTAEETIIRLTAADGVGARAADGSAEAIELLLSHLDHETFSIRRALAQAFLVAGGVDAERILHSRLAPDEQWMLGIEVIEPGFAPMPALPDPPEKLHPERQIPTPSRAQG